MDDSKSNSAFPADATSSNSIPRALAWATDSAINAGLAPNCALIWPDILFVASNVPLMSNLTPDSCSAANTPSIWFK